MLVTFALASLLFTQGTPQAAAPGVATQAPLSQAEKKHQTDIESDVELGKKYAAQVEKEEKLSKDKEYQDRVARIGAEIADIANHNQVKCSWGDGRLNPFHYEYKVIVGDDPNAFSLPGGHIYVYEGTLKFVESDDELAGILAHETAHAAFRHVATLEHEANKGLITEIPLIIAAILARSPGGISTISAWQQSKQSGWSVKAEKAADFGGFQYMLKSKYNPVAMLTFMERLARKERYLNSLIYTLGIFQTHPVTKERADTFISELHAYGVPIERSKASPSFRVLLKPGKDGTVNAFFDGRLIYRFAGLEADERARLAADRLNAFYDSVPNVFQVRTRDNEIDDGEKMLITVEQEDAAAGNTTVDALKNSTLSRIKDSILNLTYRVWDAQS